MFKSILVGILFLFLIVQVRAIDHEFSQFYASPIYLNPAFAGSVRCPRFTLASRYQWPGQLGTFVTNTASYDQYSNTLQGGVGIMASADYSGNYALSNNWLAAVYSYQVNISRSFSIKMGAQAAISQTSINASKLKFPDQIDAFKGFIYNTQEVLNRTTVIYPDFSAGILGFSKNFFAGVAVHHLAQPNVTFGDDTKNFLYRKYTFSAGALFSLGKSVQRSSIKRSSESTQLAPNVLIRMQNGLIQYNFGMYLSKSNFVIGLWYRNKDAVIALLGYQFNNLKIGYSYDLTISDLSPASFGSHELTLGLKLPCRNKPVKFRSQPCPEF